MNVRSCITTTNLHTGKNSRRFTNKRNPQKKFNTVLQTENKLSTEVLPNRTTYTNNNSATGM